MISKKDFERASPFSKGFAVYMYGNREDEPNVPKVYKPDWESEREYERGQFAAMIEVMDTEG